MTTTTSTTTNSTIPKNDINYDSLQEINQKKLQQKSINRSSLLSSFHNSYYPNKNNQLSYYNNRSSSLSSSSKRINPTLNWYLSNLKLKQRIYYLNDHDHDHDDDPSVQQKNKKKFFLINSYSDEFINEKSNDKSKSLSYNKQLLENVTQLPPMATSSSSASSPLSPQQQQQEKKKKKNQQRQRQQQQQQQHRQQHSKTWNGKKPKRNLILEEWKRKSDTVQNFTNIENVSFSTKMLTIRFWNGDELKLNPLPSEKLGDVIRSHLSDLTIPIQCIDLMSKECIPWETPTLQLSSKTLLIKKIHKNKVTPPGIHPMKKMERRSAPPFDTTSGALKNWFDFYKKSNSMNSYSLSDQLITDCLCELNPNMLVNLLGGRQKLFDENSITPTPLTAISSLDEIFRHRSNSYSRVEEIQHQNLPNNQPFDSQDLANLFFIEESWEQIVKSSSKMTKQQQKRQSAIWEFIYTEANYIKYLRTIIDYYLAPFLEIRESLFENLDTGWIFGNIEEIFKANIKLWLQYLTEPLREIRRNGDAFTPVIFKSAITHISDLFSVYKQYYVNLSRCRSYTQEAVRQSTNFCTFLEWADQQGHDHREPLWDQLTKPTTRLTQYRLLMESIRKNCCNSTEEQEVSEMFNSISEFIEEINQQMMTETKTWESLELLASKLLCCDFLDNNVDDYTQLISDYSRFKFSILSPIKLPSPVILFNDYHSISQSIPSCTKSLAFLRNRRLSGSPLFTSNNSISDARTISNHNTTSCNRSDSGIGDCNQTLSTSLSSTVSRDYTSPTGFKQRSRIYSLTNPATESFSFPVKLSRIFEGGKIQKSISLDTEFSDSISYDWSDIHYRRTIQRTVLYGGNLRFKEPPNRSIETVCHILTDLFLITKQHKKDGNDYWKLIKNPIRLDKLIIQRGRETGVFACAILDDFHNIANLYIFSAGPKCDEWITQIESAKENYRKLMEPEILIAQPLMKYQRDDLSTIIMSPDSMCSSDNNSELHNQPYGQFVDTTPTSCNSINSGKNINIEGNKRNVFFESQSSLFESINCNHTNHNNQTDSMCIIDKRIRSNNSPTIIKNHQRSSSRSFNYTSIEHDSTKMIHSTSVRNLFSSNTSDCHLLHLSLNLTETSKSTTSHLPLKKDLAKKKFLSNNQNEQKYFSMNYQNKSRFPRDLNDQQLKSESTNLDLDKVSHTIPIRQSSRFTSSEINNNNNNDQSAMYDIKSSNSTLSSSSSSSSLTSLKTEMKVPVNYPSIVICKVQSDSDEIINNNNNNRHLLSTRLHRSSVHHSLLNIERSDSSEDQITIKL
ncbi:unnamed protein product [Schistosoma rodhaini]|uniref:DH domain-containing protein n=1 Tax=Schistosoma rodhaini TaxID=6188 RepID=A0AA85ESQ0_9TREM|nr:unnamed protein product [Schistosoma rodhaini]